MTDRELRNAEVYPTWACNLNCPTCVQRLCPDRVQGSLSKQTFARFLDRLAYQNWPLKTLDFNGGEPTLWPYLCWAARASKERGLVDRVTCISNGVKQPSDAYDGIDSVRVTHYGAINRQDILRLRKQLGRRFHVSWVVHRNVMFDGPKVSPARGWPAICVAVGLHLGPDGKVYGCSNACLEARGGVDLDEPFIDILRGRDIRRQDRCLNCPANQRIFHGQYGAADVLGLVFEAGFWGGPIGAIVHIPWLNVWHIRHWFSRWYRR